MSQFVPSVESGLDDNRQDFAFVVKTTRKSFQSKEVTKLTRGLDSQDGNKSFPHGANMARGTSSVPPAQSRANLAQRQPDAIT